MARQTPHYDVALVGGGLGGLAGALALAAAGAQVVLLDKRDALAAGGGSDGGDDGRASAISPASLVMLERICGGDLAGVSDVCAMRVSDGHPNDGLLADPLCFSASQEAADDGAQKPLAHIVMNHHVRAALIGAAQKHKAINIKTNAGVAAMVRETKGARVTLENGETLACDLLIAADGRGSLLRKMAGIKTAAYDYKQTAMVCVFTHSVAHGGVAHQIFKSGGPLATLPLADAKQSALVWPEKSSYAAALMALDDAGFMAELAGRLDGLLGEVTAVTPRQSYPLTAMLAQRYTQNHFALLGEAAHIIHPLAGQGYNLTLRDAACLADCFFDAKSLGLAVGSTPALAPYASRQKADGLLMAAATHSLNALFAPQAAGLRPMRQVALGVASRLPIMGRLAQFAANYGVGNYGAGKNIPRLLCGAGFEG